jgi:NADH-quinone oxidoreductase subunit E
MSLKVDRKFTKVNEILEKYQKNTTNLIPILQEIQEEYRFLSEEILTYVATVLGSSPATVYGVATFYAQFSLLPKGKYVIKICNGTACHVRGSEKVKYAFQKKLNLSDQKNTTDDFSFTIETVSCIGACGLAPVITINDAEVHGEVTPEAVDLIVEQLLKKEGK